MIVSASDARRIIRAHYGPEFVFRISSRSATIGVRPVVDRRPTLAWLRVSPGKDSAVRIGLLLPNLTIDWGYDALGAEGYDALGAEE